MRSVKTVLCATALFLTAFSHGPSIANDCAGNENALGVSRTVKIDTTGGPGFGFEHYKFYDFLKPGEIVLTFDDGPLPSHSIKILKALADHCTKATFFPVGKLAVGYPEVLRKIANQGHTVAAHTWGHKNMAKLKMEKMKDEFEMGASAIRVALGKPGAPFFRYPFLKDSPESIKYIGQQRNFAVFSTDIDSFDFKGGRPKTLIKRVMKKLKKHGKGILLFHDINPHTARAMPELLKRFKKDGYKIVHLTAKADAITLPQYDEKVTKIMNKGRPNMGKRPMASVIETVTDGDPTAETDPLATGSTDPGDIEAAPQKTPTPAE